MRRRMAGRRAGVMQRGPEPGWALTFRFTVQTPQEAVERLGAVGAGPVAVFAEIGRHRSAEMFRGLFAADFVNAVAQPHI